MNLRTLAVLIFSLLWACAPLRAQKSIRDSSISFVWVDILYNPCVTGGDMADRFGLTNQLGGEIGYKFRNQFYAWTGVRSLFGNQVRERVAANVTLSSTDSSGRTLLYGIGPDGYLKEVRLFERGFTVPLMAGYLLPLGSKPNPNSGLYLEAGAQFLRHRIHIETIGDVPALSGDMRKGYDRLTSGIGLVQGIGYRYHSSNRLVNFFAGVEISENFTRSRRSFDYDLGRADTEQRLDLMYGLRLGWTFLIYRQAPRDEYYY